MKQIKFSHIYDKFESALPKTAILLEVLQTERKDLHASFLEYDTKYYENQIPGVGGEKLYYPLPAGKLLVLLFLSEGKLWTTIRRYTPQKLEYYLAARGETFEVVLTNE